MLFKDELPPSRYAVGDDLDDDEILAIELHVDLKCPEIKELLLLPPRLHDMLYLNDQVPVGNIQLTIKKPQIELRQLDNGLEDYDTDLERRSHVMANIYELIGERNLHAALLPSLDVEKAAYLGTHLIREALPTKLWVCAPANGAGALSQLRTSNAEDGFGPHLPITPPPTIIRGTAAAAFAEAARLEIPACALLLPADGVCDFEVVSLKNEARNVLLKALKITKYIPPPMPAVESKMKSFYI